MRMNARMQLAGANSPHQQEPGTQHFALAAATLGLLADRTRLALLHELTLGEADVGTLAEACGAARPAVSQHLARLRLAGVVQFRKEGQRVIYALRDEHLRRLLAEAFSHADHQLAATAGDSAAGSAGSADSAGTGAGRSR
jgi:DNA-binding transcriptional ArsR family regulator